MAAPKHPLHSFSLDSKTLFNSQEDLENFDLSRESLWKDWRFLRCAKALAKHAGIPKLKLSELARNLNPAELQVQTLLEILYSQKRHYTDPVNHDRACATRHYYIKALGLELSLKLDQLIDDSKTSFDFRKEPEHWRAILPARSIEAKHNLETNFRNLVTQSFNLLKTHWQKAGLVTEAGEVVEGVKPKFHTISKSSLGKDIGAKSAPYLLFGQGCSLRHWLRSAFARPQSAFALHPGPDVTYRPNTIPSIWFLYKVRRTLNKYGRRALTGRGRGGQKRALEGAGPGGQKQPSPKVDHGRRRSATQARDNAFKIIAVDPNVSTLKFTRGRSTTNPGRINCVLRGTTFNEALSPLQAFWMPFVHYFMKNDRWEAANAQENIPLERAADLGRYRQPDPQTP